VLGLGSNVTIQPNLRRIGSDTNWVDVAVGGATTLALKSDGTIWAWGENIYGQLGDGTMARQQPTPVRSVPGNDWKQVATGGPHSVALKRDGTLWSWGNNWAGQLGDGSTNGSRVPVRVGASTNWTRVWAGGIQNVGQQDDGSLWFWGWDYTRSSAGSSIPIPTRVSPDTNWVDVGMGDWTVFAVKADGTLWAWGRQARAYTGNPNAESTPVQVGTNNDWRACASFEGSCPLFMKRDGSLWAMDAWHERGVATVTAIVAGLVTNSQLNLVADSATFGGDPAFGVAKSLQIIYQLGGTNRVMTFAEDAPVYLGEAGLPLTIIRALYGDPRSFRDAAAGASPQSLPAQLRRIQAPKEIVAFEGGRHRLGVVLTSEGEVWTWGEALGRHTLISRLLKRVGIPVEPRPVILKKPSLLEKADK
jgi:alpha-tubulin suppressor-like RCC1 family protein